MGTLLAIGVWTSFGLIGSSLLLPVEPMVVLYAVLSLTVMRLLPVGLALLGAGFRRPTVWFIGWFGPRGLASVVFLVIGIDGLTAAGISTAPYAATVAWTVLLSVILHGLTSGPLAQAVWTVRGPLAPRRGGANEPRGAAGKATDVGPSCHAALPRSDPRDPA